MKVSRSKIVSVALFFAVFVSSSLAALAQSRTVRARVTQPVDTHNVVTLTGNVHPLARPEFDQGVAPDDLPMERMLLVLRRGPEQEAALRQLLDAQQEKGSPQFHQWLTPEQFGQQFGPADSDLQAVTDWLTSEGFQVTGVSAGRTVIEFSGAAGLVRQALGAEMHRFRVNGQDHWANITNPRIPAALAPVVAGFASLNNFPRKPMNRSLGTFTRNKLTGEVKPLFTFPVSCGSSTCYYRALGPTDFATIYNVLPLWNAGPPTDGSGVTIAVVGQTNINVQDVRDFRSMFGLPAKDPTIILNGPDPGINADETEADLDVQWAGAVAKGATIDFVVSETTETTVGIDLSALYIVDNNLAPIMSESYGGCEAWLGVGGNQFYNTLWEQAAAQGITVLIASGDSGSAGCDSSSFGETAALYGLGVSGLASTPFNVAVGGTDFNVSAANAGTYWTQPNDPQTGVSAKSYIPEITWNDSCAASGSLSGCAGASSTSNFTNGFDLVAGGGGPSSCINPSGVAPYVTCSGAYPKPSWQSGTNVLNDSMRDIPDVSLFAGNGLHYSFYVICQMDANSSGGGSSTSCDLNSPYTNFQGGSGTSASVQVFASVMALVVQKTGQRQGNANYVLYPMAATAFNANNNTYCNASALPTNSSGCIFYDETVGNNSVICKGGTLNCSNTTAGTGQYGIMVSGGAAAYGTSTGYDLATGLGSVNVANLVNNWTSSFTTTTVTLTPNPPSTPTPVALTHGQFFNFTVNVSAGSSTPTGDVSLIAQTGSFTNGNGGDGIGPFTLNGGSVSGSTPMLPGGSYNVIAHYAGDGTYAASDSSTGIPVTVSPESSKTFLQFVTFNLNTGAPSYGITTSPYGYPYVLRINVTNSSGQACATQSTSEIAFLPFNYACPTGTVTVTPTPAEQNPPPGTIPGTYKLNSQGYAEDVPIQLSYRTYPFVATYMGDRSYTGSTSSTLNVTITPGVTYTTLGSVPATVVAGTPVSLTASFHTDFTNGAAPTGNIQFLNNGNLAGSAALTNLVFDSATYVFSGQVTLSPTLPGGANSITAKYVGDLNYGASTSSASTITVTDFGVTANPSSVNISAPGGSGTSTISITPQNGFTGAVNLTVASGCPPGGTCILSPSSVTLSGSAATSTLTITTTAASSAPPTLQRRLPPAFHLPAGLPWLLAGLLALAAFLASPVIRRRPAALRWATILVAVGVWVACGGGGGGGGTAPPTPQPNVTLSSSSLSFGSLTTGSTSAPQTVTLTNTGTAALSITSVTITGTNAGDFSQTNTCSGSVAAGANCTIGVTFKPTATGSRSATLSIADNAGSSPQTVSLSGTGTQPTTPTPSGTYPIVVNATSGSTTHSLTVNVTVQ